MRKKRAPRKPILCSRVGCEEIAITRIKEDGKTHVVCQKCWLLAEERKLFKLKAPRPVDRKSQAAGDWDMQGDAYADPRN